MTPSPGATTCLGNAYRDTKIICEKLGVNFKQQELIDDLLDGKDYKAKPKEKTNAIPSPS